MDAGASCKIRDSPEERGGVPPPHAKRSSVNLAIGEFQPWRSGSSLYVHPGDGHVDRHFPFGLYSRKWNLRMDDFRFGGGRIAQIDSGIGIDLKWKMNCP